MFNDEPVIVSATGNILGRRLPKHEIRFRSQRLVNLKNLYEPHPLNTNLSFVPVSRDSINSGSYPTASGCSSDCRPPAVLPFVCFVTCNSLELFSVRRPPVYLKTEQTFAFQTRTRVRRTPRTHRWSTRFRAVWMARSHCSKQ